MSGAPEEVTDPKYDQFLTKDNATHLHVGFHVPGPYVVLSVAFGWCEKTKFGNCANIPLYQFVLN